MTKLGLSGASTFSVGIYFRETFHYVRVYVEASILGSYTLGPGRLADFSQSQSVGEINTPCQAARYRAGAYARSSSALAALRSRRIVSFGFDVALRGLHSRRSSGFAARALKVAFISAVSDLHPP